MSPILTPKQLRTELPLTKQAEDTVTHARNSLKNSLKQNDNRLIVIVGPCSIHHPEFAIRYAEKLRKKIIAHKDNLTIVMRTYVEKSRTSLGWKGFINDPDLNNSFNIEKGLREARSLFLRLNNAGVPIATEIINPYIALYLSDLISWAAIGARTTESQLHREFASQLQMPVGFKNNTNGDIQVAIDAAKTARASHSFFTPTLSGQMDFIQSPGNPDTHVVLRGSTEHANYDLNTIAKTHAFSPVIIDCSHGNSQKNYKTQLLVAKTLASQIQAGNDAITGIMLESYLNAGKQTWSPTVAPSPDQSITDACIGWDETSDLLDLLSEAVRIRREVLV